MDDRQEITLLLERWRKGDRLALDDLFSALYLDLKNNARGALRQIGGEATLSATEIANEAYLRLANYPMHAGRSPFANRRQFFGLAQKAMLHVLIDRHKRKSARRRGGDLCRADLDANAPIAEQPAAKPDLSSLERVLGELALVRPDWFRVIHQRFTAEQTATVRQLAQSLGLSEREIYRKTNLGIAWMRKRLAQEARP